MTKNCSSRFQYSTLRANLSKLFSSIRSSHCGVLDAYAAARINVLRKLYDNTDNNPILSRKLRNAYEHYDPILDHLTSQHDCSSWRVLEVNGGFVFDAGSRNAVTLGGETFHIDDFKEPMEKILGRAKSLVFEAMHSERLPNKRSLIALKVRVLCLSRH